jgi:hypothetical protein
VLPSVEQLQATIAGINPAAGMIIGEIVLLLRVATTTSLSNN